VFKPALCGLCKGKDLLAPFPCRKKSFSRTIRPSPKFV
jgi:hypothetical protein